MRRRSLILAVALVVTACGNDAATTDTRPTGPPPTIGAAQTTTTIDPRPCPATTVIAPRALADGSVAVRRITGGNPHAAAVAASQAMFDCAADVVVVDAADLDRIALAASLAAAFQAPLLFGEEGETALIDWEMERLAPQRAWLVGDLAESHAPGWTEITRIRGTNDEIAERIADLVGADDPLTLPTVAGPSTVAAAIAAMLAGRPVVPAPTGEGAALVTHPLPADIVVGSAESGLVWLVDDTELASALAAAAGVMTSHGFMGLVTGSDLRHDIALSADLVAIADRVKVMQIVGATDDARWQARVLLRGDQIPGGGFLVLPRRIITLYGNPLTTSLGPLGEQGPEEAANRIEQMAAGYDADGVPVITGFEIITTVAAGNPGNDGDYSNEMEIPLIREWVDAARRHGQYVLLDLQPGRTDFLTQAKLYEELLLEPHVGLALDPEWRLKPDEFHLAQIGSVEAAEVNEVVDWLAALVREHALPQKVLLIHQFVPWMLPDRDQIKATPELQLIIQMDGHGEILEKLTTWQRTTAGWETDQFAYGWKHFFDEDIPGPIGPEKVLELVPTVVFISFQ